MRWKVKKITELSWFRVLVKVKQIDEYLLSDTEQSPKKQKVAVNDVTLSDCEMTVRWNNQPRSIPGISVQSVV